MIKIKIRDLTPDEIFNKPIDPSRYTRKRPANRIAVLTPTQLLGKREFFRKKALRDEGHFLEGDSFEVHYEDGEWVAYGYENYGGKEIKVEVTLVDEA